MSLLDQRFSTGVSPAPSSGLIISGGGVLTIATDEIAELQARCRALELRLDELAWQLADLAARTSRLLAPGIAASAFTAAGRMARAAAAQLGRARGALQRAEQTYSEAEWDARRRASDEAARAAYGAGMLGALELAMLGPGCLLLVGAAALTARGPLELASGAAARWLAQHPEALSDPRFLVQVRLLSDSLDNAGRGAAATLGSQGWGTEDEARGREQFAAVVLAAASLGFGRASTAVEVTPIRTGSTSAPRTLETLASRIPGQQLPPAGAYVASGDPTRGEGDAEPSTAQVRVDRYDEQDGSPRYVVYLAGTADFSLQPGSEPFDMSSNLAGMAGLDSAALESARAAMADAGIGANDPVLLVGYSQGGLLAERLADSGEYATAGLVTFGSPGPGVDAQSVPVVALAHTDDLVPALGGVERLDASLDHVLVERSALDGMPVPEGRELPAHDLNAYRYTAQLADASGESRLTTTRTQVFDFLKDTSFGTSTEYHAVRTAER